MAQLGSNEKDKQEGSVGAAWIYFYIFMYSLNREKARSEGLPFGCGSPDPYSGCVSQVSCTYADVHREAWCTSGKPSVFGGRCGVKESGKQAAVLP